MQIDAVSCTPTLMLRRHFYTFMQRVSGNSDLLGFSRYMRDGLSENRELHSCGNMETFPYLKHLYTLQLIHQKNVEFVLKFAEYTQNMNLIHHIKGYYTVVGGREPLLISAKFNTSSDRFIQQPVPISSPPQYPMNREIIPANYQPLPNVTSNYGSLITNNTPQPMTVEPRGQYQNYQSTIVNNIAEPKPNAPISNTNIATAQQYEMPPNLTPYIYPITKDGPHGYCVIINNEYFHSLSNLPLKQRAGTKKDGLQLEKTFNNLNYITQAYNDITTSKMKNILQDLSKQDHTKFDSFVCCLLSHGNSGRIFGADSTEIELKDIYNLFDTENCPTLKGKPKIFIVQACRGTDIDTGSKKLYEDSDVFEPMQFDVPQPQPIEEHELPRFCDFLIAYGTVEGYVAWRHPDHGSWFIDILCNKLRELFDRFNIVQILTFVNSDISQKKTNEGSKQMAEPVNMMQGLFYFKPPVGTQVTYI